MPRRRSGVYILNRPLGLGQIVFGNHPWGIGILGPKIERSEFEPLDYCGIGGHGRLREHFCDLKTSAIFRRLYCNFVE